MLTIKGVALGLTAAAILSVGGLAVDRATAPPRKVACGGSPISAFSGYCGPLVVDRATGMRLRNVSVWFSATGVVYDVLLGS
jgi:hypothetical protein